MGNQSLMFYVCLGVVVLAVVGFVALLVMKKDPK
jgi:hypothetical protein